MSGFQPDIMVGLSVNSRIWLVVDNIWVAFGIFLCGVTSSFLVWFSNGSWLITLLAGGIVMLLLWALQGMVITGTGINCAQNITDNLTWRPSYKRVLPFIIIALLFSQPLITIGYYSVESLFNEDELNKKLSEESNLRLELLKSHRQNTADEMKRQLGVLEEALTHLRPQSAVAKPSVSSSTGVSQGKPSESRRKAILIGNQSYPNAPPSSPAKDAHDLAGALRSMGFSVTELINATRKDMELALLRYENSIQPGDISFLYFNGYGFQQHGNNFLVGTDLPTPDKPNAVGLNLLIESINEKSPQASVMVIDACNLLPTVNTDGLAELEASNNTYIAFACKPGQSILDNRSVKSQSFSTALMNNISRPVDIDTIFRDIQSEVRLQTHGAQESWWSNGLKGSLMLASADSIHSAETSRSSITKSFSNDAIYSSPEVLPCKTTGLTSISSAASSQKQAECIASKMLRLRDDLAEFQARTAKLTTNMARESWAVSGSLATLTVLFYSIWTNPVVAFALTALLVLLIAGGFIHRDFWPNATREYALAVHAKHRQFVSGMLGDLAAKLPEFPKAPPPNMIRKPSFLPLEQDSQGTLGDFNSLHAYWSVQPVQEKQ